MNSKAHASDQSCNTYADAIGNVQKYNQYMFHNVSSVKNYLAREEAKPCPASVSYVGTTNDIICGGSTNYSAQVASSAQEGQVHTDFQSVPITSITRKSLGMRVPMNDHTTNGCGILHKILPLSKSMSNSHLASSTLTGLRLCRICPSKSLILAANERSFTEK